jgi:hypothetical protein
VARDSAKEQIFEVGHHAKVKAKLVELLISEVVAVVNMNHETIIPSSNINDEGMPFLFFGSRYFDIFFTL